MSETEKRNEDDFDALASGKRTGLVAEFLEFLGHNKKWWLLPIAVVILVLGGLMLIGGGPAAPFIYTLF